MTFPSRIVFAGFLNLATPWSSWRLLLLLAPPLRSCEMRRRPLWQGPQLHRLLRLPFLRQQQGQLLLRTLCPVLQQPSRACARTWRLWQSALAAWRR